MKIIQSVLNDKLIIFMSSKLFLPTARYWKIRLKKLCKTVTTLLSTLN